MTIDREKLKALAEAQPVQVWTRTRGRRPDMKGQPLMYGVEGPEGVSDYEDWGFTGKAADYIAAACPATVLALLAEIERLATSRSKKERELEQELETWHHGPFCWTCGDTGDVHDITGEWRGECDCLSAQLINANRERDQLKAENEALRKQIADLWPLKNVPPQDFRASNKCLACGDYHHGLGNLPCPRCTPVAQSAMAKEVPHG